MRKRAAFWAGFQPRPLRDGRSAFLGKLGKRDFATCPSTLADVANDAESLEVRDDDEAHMPISSSTALVSGVGEAQRPSRYQRLNVLAIVRSSLIHKSALVVIILSP